MHDNNPLTPVEREALQDALHCLEYEEDPFPPNAMVCVAALARLVGQPISIESVIDGDYSDNLLVRYANEVPPAIGWLGHPDTHEPNSITTRDSLDGKPIPTGEDAHLESDYDDRNGGDVDLDGMPRHEDQD